MTEPVCPVSVFLKKVLRNGTVSDADGNYSISAQENATLVFSFVGFTSQEIPIEGKSSIDIVLRSDVLALNEVVIVGYGQQEKKDVTGVVSAVSSKDFNKGAIVSPDVLIAGKVAGVQITPASGEPGVDATIRIRGGTSINASNEPLFVIDGVPIDNASSNAVRNPLNFLNPNDIETFTVLKDASAAAIYGSRAANGVIIITTKKGTAGMPTVSYDGWYSVSQVANKLEVFTADEYRELVAGKSSGDLSLLGDANTDWQNEIFRTAVGRNHNISIAGGGENTTYRLSINDLRQEGTIKTSETKRTGFSLNISSAFLNKSLRTNFSLKGSQTNEQFSAGVVGSALAFDPTQPVYLENSPFGGYFEWENDLGSKNPVAELNMINDKGRNNRGIGNFTVAYDIPFVKGLTANVNFGFDMANGYRKTFRPNNLRSQANNLEKLRGEIYYQNPIRHSELMEIFGTYKKDLESIESSLEVTAGYSYQDFSAEFPAIVADSLRTNKYGPNNFTIAKNYNAFNSIQENRLISFYGRVNYSFKDRYILTASLRRDGSSRFGPENRWGIFPSAALAWRAIDESFLSGLTSTFTDLKLRVSYGVNGNQDFGNYLYLPTYTEGDNFTRYQFGNKLVNTVRPNGYDSELQWEETKSLNVGVDFGILNGRLNGSIEYYNKRTDELLFNTTAPAGSNLTNRILTNIGEIENQGVELSLDATIVSTSDLRWNVGFNGAYNKNKIVTLDGNEDPEFVGILTGGISGGVGNTIQILSVGSPVNAFYVYQHKMNGDKPLPDGVDYNEDGAINGLDIYVDQDNSGTIDEGDLVKYKQPAPKMIFGLTSNLNYKAFDLNFTLRSCLGSYVYNNNASNTANYSRISELVTQNVLTSVLETNFVQPQYFSDYYIENASFLKMDNITLGYSLNELLTKSKMKARIYATVQNVFTLTEYSGIDPEANSRTDNNGVRTNNIGIDNNIYPRSRTFVFGVSLGF
jgi:TonB-linked SusC/RagA family outer membrane protein